MLRQHKKNQAQNSIAPIFYCNNAGTVARFMLPILAIKHKKSTVCQELILTGDERLCQRPISDLVDSLRTMGMNIRYMQQEGYMPLSIIPTEPTRKMTSLSASQSSQFASALLLYGTALPHGITINLIGRISSRPYIEMTCAVLQQAGATVTLSHNKHIYTVSPIKSTSTSKSITIENDWSAASYFYTMAAMMPKQRIRLRGLSIDSFQGDKVIAQLFTHFGVTTNTVRTPYMVQAKSITICKTEKSKTKLQYNFIDHPDLLPTVAVACAALGIKGELRGIRNLRLKESDRVEAIATELRRMGGAVTIAEDEMIIKPSILNPIEPVQTYGDHRIAMAFAPLLLQFPKMTIENPEVVSKSFPNFWKEFDKVQKASDKVQKEQA